MLPVNGFPLLQAAVMVVTTVPAEAVCDMLGLGGLKLRSSVGVAGVGGHRRQGRIDRPNPRRGIGMCVRGRRQGSKGVIIITTADTGDVSCTEGQTAVLLQVGEPICTW